MQRPITAALAASLVLLSVPATYAATSASRVSNAVETHIKRGAPRVEDLEEIQTYVAKHPDDLHGRFVLGELLASGGYQELASEQFDTIAKRSPNHVLEEFHDLLRNHSFDTANWIGYYVSKKWPDDSGVLFAMGRQALIKGQRRKAMDLFTKALHAKPVWPEVYTGLAELSFALNRKDEAIKYADTAIEINPRDESAMAIKTAAQAELSGHPEKYLSDLETFAPRNWSNDSVSLQLAQAYINTGKWNKAVQPALYALEYSQFAHKKQAEAQIKLLMDKVASGKMIADLNYVSPLDARDYTSTVLRLRFAKCLSDIGAHQQATKILLQALNMHPFFTPELNYRLGLEYTSMNQPKDALLFYKMAHELRPEEPDYERAYKRAEMRFNNQSNDIARRLKQVLKPHSRT